VSTAPETKSIAPESTSSFGLITLSILPGMPLTYAEISSIAPDNF
jgi:hypothetical protein